MSRTVEEIIELGTSFLAAGHTGLVPLLAGVASSLSAVEEALEDYEEALTVAGADGRYLDLIGKNVGAYRSSEQSDEDFREVIRTPVNKVTRAALEEAMDRVFISAFPTLTYDIYETWLDSTHLDVDAYCTWDRIIDQPRGFVIRVDVVVLNVNHPIYAAIVAEITRISRAGALWALVIEDAP